MHLIEDKKKLIEKFKRSIEALLGEDKVKLILFGSKARGDFDRHSYIDIAIIVKKLTRKQKNLILEEIADFEFENIMPLSTLILSEKEFSLLKKRERAIGSEIESVFKLAALPPQYESLKTSEERKAVDHSDRRVITS